MISLFLFENETDAYPVKSLCNANFHTISNAGKYDLITYMYQIDSSLLNKR